MHFVSIGNLIIMLLFWVGSYLVTIWLMSCLFPATPATKGKKGEKSESQIGNVSAAVRQLSPPSIERLCTTESMNSASETCKRLEQDAVMSLIDHKRHIGG